VRDVIDNAVSTVIPSAQAKGVRLQCECEADAIVMGDRDRLQQIVWNLLHNAVKFTPSEGSVVVRVAVQESLVTIAVQDTGRGIPADFVPHVFERFRQEQGSPLGASGLGLGLAIVKDLVELHGGRVEASSAGPGQGATFTVFLPVWDEQGSRAEPGNSAL
jgi:signal transduction histidine kinase